MIGFSAGSIPFGTCCFMAVCAACFVATSLALLSVDSFCLSSRLRSWTEGQSERARVFRLRRAEVGRRNRLVDRAANATVARIAQFTG